MKQFLFTILLLSLSSSLFAQKEYKLDSLTVTAKGIDRLKEVSVGTRVSNMSVKVLEENKTKSLSELLTDNSMAYIKGLGQGAMATSSFRGTSSSHTQVNWNGININPKMSSSFDFSQVPVFFTDNVALYHGSSHLKSGTGALGGSINLMNLPRWSDTTLMRLFAQVGSYDTYTGGASVRFVKEKWLWQTRVYYQQSENDYKYLNKVLSKDPFYENRKEGQYKQAGAMQEVYWRPSAYSNFSSNLWVQYGKRRLPQPIIVNVVQHEEQEELGLKYFVGYDYNKDKHSVSAKVAYTLDFFDYRQWFDSEFYEKADTSSNKTQSLHFIGDYTYNNLSGLKLNVSTRYTLDMVDALSYSKSNVNRNVFILQANALWDVNNFLTLNGQVMGEVNDGKMAPTFSGSFNIKPAKELSIKGTAAYNYKYPSLNDLYWQPGGNKDLLPEKGFAYDITVGYAPTISNVFSLKADVSYYLMNIDNWIMWLPTKNWYWEPRNVHKVLSHGLEASAELTASFSEHLKGRLNFNYTFARSMNREKNFEEDNTYNKQLPYVPKHKANARLSLSYKQLYFTYKTTYTGIRYTSQDESYQTNAYTIHFAELSYKWVMKNRYSLTPKLSVDNLFNAYYESTQYYPMPLRNLSFGVEFGF